MTAKTLKDEIREQMKLLTSQNYEPSYLLINYRDWDKITTSTEMYKHKVDEPEQYLGLKVVKAHHFEGAPRVLPEDWRRSILSLGDEK